jgi:hypothetical protein
MRYTTVTTGVLLSAVVFSSCTCQKQLEQPRSFQEPPGGFHAAKPGQPDVRAQAPTVTPAAKATPAEVAAAPNPPVPVPQDFPKDVPIFKDAVVAQVQDLANDAHNVIFHTAAPVAEVYSFYQQKMSQEGWQVAQQFEHADRSFVSFKKGNMIANLTIVEDTANPGQQVIAIMYEEQKPLEFEEF